MMSPTGVKFNGKPLSHGVDGRLKIQKYKCRQQEESESNTFHPQQ